VWLGCLVMLPARVADHYRELDAPRYQNSSWPGVGIALGGPPRDKLCRSFPL